MAQKSPAVLRRSMSTLRSVSQSSGVQSVPLTPMVRKAPSFMGILASKRLARQFASRVAARRMGRLGTSSRSTSGPGPEFEPTYRLQPKHKFESAVVTGIICDVLQARLPGFVYNARQASLLCKVLSEEIKDRVKICQYDRYKIICLVTLGEKKSQGVRLTSRCAWDPSLDNWASHTWENSSAYCTATVYGVYHE